MLGILNGEANLVKNPAHLLDRYEWLVAESGTIAEFCGAELNGKPREERQFQVALQSQLALEALLHETFDVVFVFVRIEEQRHEGNAKRAKSQKARQQKAHPLQDSHRGSMRSVSRSAERRDEWYLNGLSIAAN